MNDPSPTLSMDDLPPPYILENPAYTTLNPVVISYSLTIAVDGLQSTDRVSVTWQGAPGTPAEGSYTSAFVEVGDRRPVKQQIPTSLVAFNQGKTVTLTYRAIRNDSLPVTSQPLTLYVLPVAQGDLPRPIIEQADRSGEGLQLFMRDLIQFTLRVNAWVLLTQGQYFWARLKGTKADDSAFDESYWRAPFNVVDVDFSRFGFFAQNFSATPLKELKDRSILTLEFGASLIGSQDENDAIRFAPRHYIVRKGAPSTPDTPVILSVRDSADRHIADGGSTLDTRVTISGTAVAGEQVEVFDGTDSKGLARAESGTWVLPLTGLAIGPHPFTANALYGDGETSEPWTIVVILQGQLPSIEEAPDNISLDPLMATSSLTAVVDYDMLSTDLISVTVTAAPGTPAAGSHTTTPVVAGSTRPRKIALPIPLVAFSIGKTMEVTFTYTRGASGPVTSQPLRLRVQYLPPESRAAPVITQANGSSILDLKDVQSGATLLFGVWPHIATGQPIWLDLEGQNASGSHNLTIWMGSVQRVHRAWVSNGTYSINISSGYLQALRHDSKLIIRFRVNLDQVANPATVAAFQVREYTIRSVP